MLFLGVDDPIGRFFDSFLFCLRCVCSLTGRMESSDAQCWSDPKSYAIVDVTDFRHGVMLLKSGRVASW